MVIRVLVHRDVHGTDPGALVAMVAVGCIPRQSQDTDAVKEAEDRSKGAYHATERPFGKGRQGNNNNENGDLYPEKLVDHETDLRVDRHPGQTTDEGTNRAELGKPGLKCVKGNNENEPGQNSVFYIGHPAGDLQL